MEQKTGPTLKPAKKKMSPVQRKSSNKKKKDNNVYLCVKYYLQGNTMQQVCGLIYEETGRNITISTVSNYIKEAVEGWKVEQNEFITEHKVIEIQKINRLEAEYWQAWEDSKKAISFDKLIPGKTPRAKKVLVESQLRETHGDPRFLTGVQWCVDKRCEILGTDAPQKIEANISGTITNNTTVRRVVFKSKEYTGLAQTFTEKIEGE